MRTAIGILLWAICSVTANAVELVSDPCFCQGFYVKDRAGKDQLLRWKDALGRDQNQTPVWRTAQHDSKSCFADTAFCKFRNGGLTFRDDFETLIVHPEDGQADIILGVNAMKEYGGIWRKPGDPWPHLYVQQDICQPGSRMWTTAPTNADLERLNLNLSVRLLYDHQNRGPEFNPNIHAAQFQCFLTVQNLNTKSKGFSDYYWFGVSLYDNRREVTTLLAMQDASQAHKKGTEKFIYDVGIAPFTSEVVGKGNWVTVRGDLLPHIRAGLEECWKRGFLPDSKNLADYRIGGIFLGWEIPGLNDAVVAVKDLSLTATLKAK